ncbi:MAG: hypothetical protein ACKOZT_12585, partial [Cyanobium sp.]
MEEEELQDHGHVVAQKELAVVGHSSERGVCESGNRADGSAVNGNQGALKNGFSPEGHVLFLSEEREKAESGHGGSGELG